MLITGLKKGKNKLWLVSLLLKKTNIEEKLERLKKKKYSEEKILKAVKTILENDNKIEDRILDTITNGTSINYNSFDFDLLETKHIYHIEQIKEICVDYRLRFLDSKYFKGKLPYEALSKIKALEKAHHTKLKGFKIIAPSKLFKLEKNDNIN